jgi:hypothetical protein
LAARGNHLLADLSLKLLCLAAEFIQLIEDGLEFFRRQTGHVLSVCKPAVALRPLVQAPSNNSN